MHMHAQWMESVLKGKECTYTSSYQFTFYYENALSLIPKCIFHSCLILFSIRSTWRADSGCGVECSGGRVFSECVEESCEMTCKQLGEEKTCEKVVIFYPYSFEVILIIYFVIS